MAYTQDAFTGRTGARPISAISRHVSRELTARLEGSADVERNTLYAVLEGAKSALGLGAPAIETLKHIVSYTRPEDWKGDRTPYAWPSNFTLAEQAGVGESAIKARLRQIRSTGLIAPHDSGHGRRTGRRDATGRISKAYGFDLSPLRARYAELKAAAEAHSAQSRLFREGKQEISRVRRIVGQALAQAGDMRLTGPHWIALQDAIDKVTNAASLARAVRDSTAFEDAIDCLPEIEEQVGDTIDRFMFPDEIDPSGSKSAPVIHIQTNPYQDSVQADQDRSSGGERPVMIEPALPASPSSSSFKTSPAELLTMFPSMAIYVTARRPTWDDLHRAAARLRHDLGIRNGVWVEAMDSLGLDGAAVAMMITAERHARNEIRLTPGAYFAGMVTRGQRDELDLAKSLWGFRTAGPTRQ